MDDFDIGNLMKLLRANSSKVRKERFAEVVFWEAYHYKGKGQSKAEDNLDGSAVNRIYQSSITVNALENLREYNVEKWFDIGESIYGYLLKNKYIDTGLQIQSLVMNEETIHADTKIGFEDTYTKAYIGKINESEFNEKKTLVELIASALRYTILSVGNQNEDMDKKEKNKSVSISNDYRNNADYEALREKIADTYYISHKIKDVELVGTNVLSDKINQSLIDVFCFPSFVGGASLDLEEDRHIFICAPNGFGKSTLLKALLCATNPSREISKQPELVKRIKELRKCYKIDKEYLSLFVELKELNDKNPCKTDKDLWRWLLFASKLENVLKLDEFRELVTYYHQTNCLLLIFDSVDEVIPQIIGEDINRDGVFARIRLLTCADGICSNAKVIVASRPLTFSEDDMQYRYLRIDSLLSQKENVETIIARYSPNYKDELMNYIYGDIYLKYLVTTPALLLIVIARILLEKYNEEFGSKNIEHGRYWLIQQIIRDNMMRFKHKKIMNYSEKKYEHIYEIFSYVSLFNYIENRKDDLEIFQDLILKYELKGIENHKKPIEPKDIVDVYEHFCLLNTQDNYLEFLAPEVMRPYYLAGYMYKFCRLAVKDEQYNSEKVRSMFESITNNKYGSETCFYDMLVFYFGITYDMSGNNTDPYKEQMRSIWINYIVDKWEKLKDDDSVKKILRSRLQYLLESDFVIDSCFSRILNDEDDLPENEMRLKGILVEIQKGEL